MQWVMGSSKMQQVIYARVPAHVVPLPPLGYPSMPTWAKNKKFQFAAKGSETVHVFITVLKSVQLDHSIGTKQSDVFVKNRKFSI